MSIEGATLVVAVRDADLRKSQAGKPWMSIVARSGEDDAAQFIQISVFGDAAVNLGHVEKGELIYATGSVHRSDWTTQAGEKRGGVQMSSWRAERPQIAAIRPSRSRSRKRGWPRQRRSHRRTISATTRSTTSCRFRRTP